MFALDLFNNDHERRLAEGAVDQLEQRRIDDLAMKMDDLVARAKNPAYKKNPAALAALMKEFQKCKAERDSYYKVRNETMGYGSMVGEGQMKQEMHKAAERMTLTQFINRYGDEEWIREFWNNVNGPMDEAGIPGNVPAEKIPGKEDLLKGKGRSYYEAQIQKKNSEPVDEHGGGIGPKQHWQDLMQERKLSVGDPVVVTAPNEFEGKTGEIHELSPSGKFVIVDLYNHGKHSMHLSDVEYNQYADEQEEDDWYDEGVAEGWSDAMVARRTGTPRTPYSVYIKGKKWKDFENDDHAEAVANKLRAKFKAEGRDPSVITIAPTDMSEATGDNKFDAMMGKISKDPWTQLNSDPNWEYEIEELVDQHIEPWLLAMEKSGMPITRDNETLNPGWRKRYEQISTQLAQKYLTSKKFNPRDPDLVGKIRAAIDNHTDQSRNVHGQLSAYANDLPMQRYADAFDADGMTANIRDAMAGLAPRDDDDDGYAPRPAANPRRLDPGNMEEAKADLSGSWVVYNGNKVKRFKSHTGAKAYAEKNGGKVASSEYYQDKIQKQGVDEAIVASGPSKPLDDRAVRKMVWDTMKINADTGEQAIQRALAVLAKKPQSRMVQDLQDKFQGLADRLAQGVAEEQKPGFGEFPPKQEITIVPPKKLKSGETYQDRNKYWQSQGQAPIYKTNEDNDPRAGMAQIYRRLAPKIERYRDSFLAGQLYDELENYAELHGAEREFKQMMATARGRAHMEYDTNPGGFHNWFWFLPFAEEELSEEQDTSGVEHAILNRIMVAHTDLLMKFGPEKVMQAAEEVAYNVGDVDEIGTSDVSAYVHQVKQILGVPEEVNEKWSQKYKSSINCANPKGFSQKAHCAGRKK
jgi:hypothetical protein